MARVIPIEHGIREAVGAIRRGGVVAFPTDTVYGIGADARNGSALRSLYTLKGRDADKPIPLLLSDIDVLESVCAEVSPLAKALAERFFPGALTLIVPLGADFPPELNGGRTTVGVRVPNHDGAQRLLAECGGFLAVTSANRSDELPVTNAQEIAAVFRDALDVILDGGETLGNVPSTVLDTTVNPPKILREGVVRHGQLLSVLSSLLD